MSLETLENTINEYASIQVQEEVLKTRKEELRQQIISALKEEGTDSYTTSLGNSAKVMSKTTIKYLDESAIIRFFKKNNLNGFISEKLNTTEVNKELKRSQTLNESLNSYFTEEVSQSLTVKGA